MSVSSYRPELGSSDGQRASKPERQNIDCETGSNAAEFRGNGNSGRMDDGYNGSRVRLPRRRGSLYLRLAVSGIAKNGRTYLPYLLTCAGMVMMYYLFLFLSRDRYVAGMRGGDTLQSMLQLGSGVFLVFIVIFLFYTNSFLVRNRQREFGLYNILGMGKRHLARVLIWESALVSLISLAAGLFCGILFSKLGELWIVRVIQGDAPMDFSVDAGAVLTTCALFLAVFALILLKALFTLGRSKPVELLHSSAVGEKPPKGNWLLAIVGFVMLAAAYYIAVSIEDPISALVVFFGAVAMVIVSTYLLFISGSVKLCRMLQCRKRYYYKANHFVSVSSMMYRMKRNGAGLASICVLSTMVLVMVSSVTCLYVGEEDSLMTRYPRQIELHSDGYERTEHVAALAEETAKEFGVAQENVLAYRYVGVDSFMQDNEAILNYANLEGTNPIADMAKIMGLYFVPIEDYNRVMGAQETLADDEVLLYMVKGEFPYDTLSIREYGSWKVKGRAEHFTHNGDGYSLLAKCMFVFVPDIRVCDEIADIAEQIALEQFGREMNTKYFYYGFDTMADAKAQKELWEKLWDRVYEVEDAGEIPHTTVNYREGERAMFCGLNGGLFVLGALLGSVFLLATVLIMYYKQITEGYEDATRFGIMRKVGMTKREIRGSIRSQMFTVFLAPLLLSCVHTMFAFPIVQKILMLLGLLDEKLLLCVMLACFLVFAVFYGLVYLATSRAYYKIVSGAA